MSDLLQILEAALILGAFLAVQSGRLAPTAPRALVLNAVGASLLAVLAARGRQWGFLLLEVTWALVAAWGLLTQTRRRRRRRARVRRR